jgi:RNase H-fold protein (predicted Holliday junction resolvase)
MIIHLDGKEYDLNKPGELASFNIKLEKVRTDSVAALDALKEVNVKADKEKGRADQLDADLKKERAEFPVRLDAAVAERVALETTAAALLGTAFAGRRKDAAGAEVRKTDREIMVEVVRADSAEFSDAGKSDDYVRARFDLVREKGKRADSITTVIEQVQQLKDGVPVVRQDASFTVDEIRAESITATRNAWNTPAAKA